MRLPASCAVLLASLLSAATPSLADQPMIYNGKPTGLSEPLAARLRVDLEKAAGNSAYSSLKAVTESGRFAACGMVDTKSGRLPFHAFFDNGPKEWEVSVATNTGNNYYAVFSVCGQMGAALPGWNDMLDPVNVGPAEGNTGNVTLTDDQRAQIERGVAEKIGLSAPAKVRGLVARRDVYGDRGRKITQVCGFGFDGKRYVPFLGVLNKGKDGQQPFFAVSAIGGKPAKTFAAHQICAKRQLQLPGRI